MFGRQFQGGQNAALAQGEAVKVDDPRAHALPITQGNEYALPDAYTPGVQPAGEYYDRAPGLMGGLDDELEWGKGRGRCFVAHTRTVSGFMPSLQPQCRSSTDQLPAAGEGSIRFGFIWFPNRFPTATESPLYRCNFNGFRVF